MDAGCPPEEMIDPNTRTDYGKMKKLLQFDKLDGERKGIIRKIAEEEQIVTQLYESFSAYQIPKAEIFPSLLFYYGMLTIKGTRGSKLILGIPNNNVRKQYYGYLEEEYQAKAYVDVNQLTDYYYDMAYDGKWEEGLRCMSANVPVDAGAGATGFGVAVCGRAGGVRFDAGASGASTDGGVGCAARGAAWGVNPLSCATVRTYSPFFT
jgi:hypothetical protein